MPTIRQLKRRITTVKNTAKITNALQLVAASKMRRAQDRALQARPYAEKLRVVLAGLATQRVGDAEEAPHPLLVSRPGRERRRPPHHAQPRPLRRPQLEPQPQRRHLRRRRRHEPVSVVAVGQEGPRLLRPRSRPRCRRVHRAGRLPDAVRHARHLPPRHRRLPQRASSTASTSASPSSFRPPIQRPIVRQLLPIEPPQRDAADEAAPTAPDYIFEPVPEVVLERLLPRYIEMQIYEAILESAASEQSARMVAMKNATDNATEIERELTLTYNKARQEQITKELLDIVGGAAALEDYLARVRSSHLRHGRRPCRRRAAAFPGRERASRPMRARSISLEQYKPVHGHQDRLGRHDARLRPSPSARALRTALRRTHSRPVPHAQLSHSRSHRARARASRGRPCRSPSPLRRSAPGWMPASSASASRAHSTSS